MSDYGPEISDLIVAYDPDTLARQDVRRQHVLDRLRDAGLPARASRAARAFTDQRNGLLDRTEVDGVLVRSHLELQRLHEEFRIGAQVRDLLLPMIEALRAELRGPITIVDIGCGVGFILRWIAARGGLGDDVKLIGADYNVALIEAATRLAAAEHLPCTFVAANAFTLREPAHIVISTGVLHHFRGADLTAFFDLHERSDVRAFIHTDIRPSLIAPLGSWIFHQARMREPLAQFDGYWSTVRAHPATTLRDAISRGAPSFALAMLDARPGLRSLMRIFQSAIAVRSPNRALLTAYAHYGKRLELL